MLVTENEQEAIERMKAYLDCDDAVAKLEIEKWLNKACVTEEELREWTKNHES